MVVPRSLYSAPMITALMIALAPATPEAAPSLAPVAPLDDAIIALVQEGEAEDAPRWTGSVALSVISTTGNTETDAFNADAGAELRRDVDRYTAKAYFNYGSEKDDGTSNLTSRKGGASLKYDYFVNEDETTYVFANGGGEFDALAKLDLRAQVGGGVGYQFWETDESKLSGEIGLNLFKEEFAGGAEDEYAALRLAATSFEQLSDDLTWTTSAELYPSVEESDDIYGKLDTKFALSLTEAMFTSAQLVVDYDNTPAAGADRVDQRLVLSLGWSF